MLHACRLPWLSFSSRPLVEWALWWLAPLQMWVGSMLGSEWSPEVTAIQEMVFSEREVASTLNLRGLSSPSSSFACFAWFAPIVAVVAG
mmetsp:Transcript_45473/g.120074  ORF Transcript_45473/g.120074 Transcript_45473/m.120074 type:complete len:89 (-) Transcript_45473:779-1045(-)